MLRVVLGRLAFALALPFVAFIGAFLLTALAPGDPLATLDGGVASARAIARERSRLGLDRPLTVRLAERTAGLLRLDLGTSIRYRRPVRALVLERAGSTLLAGLAALVLAIGIGIPAGVLSARTRSAAVRHGISGASLLLLSLPALVIALLLAMSASTSRLPPLVVMTLALGLPAAALLERAQARALADALQETSLQAARARGVPRAAVTWRHAWPLSLPAVLGLASVIAGQLLSGALPIEVVTARSGLGLLTYEALLARDTELAAGCAAVAALLVGVVTLLADLLQLWMDPRARDGADVHGTTASLVTATQPLR